MYWKSIGKGGRTIELYDSESLVFCTITEDAENYIFNLEGAPEDFKILKSEINDPIAWAGDFIGADISDLVIEPPNKNEDEPDRLGPFLSFVDDENKAVWQVWDVE